jgi:hypothetical protein
MEQFHQNFNLLIGCNPSGSSGAVLLGWHQDCIIASMHLSSTQKTGKTTMAKKIKNEPLKGSPHSTLATNDIHHL